jgi:hypothetical protein
MKAAAAPDPLKSRTRAAALLVNLDSISGRL